MSNDFNILLDASGLSQREAADVLGVAYDSVRSWSQGRRNCPDGVLLEMLPMVKKNLREAVTAVEAIEKRLKSAG